MEESIYSTPPQGRFEELFEHAMSFLSNPYKLWTLGQLAHKRTVLKLAFLDRLTYNRKTGLQTPLIALPFKVLDNLNGEILKMVEDSGFEPLTPCVQSRCSTKWANPPRQWMFIALCIIIFFQTKGLVKPLHSLWGRGLVTNFVTNGQSLDSACFY